MVIVGCDTETTGLDFFKGDRIIEVCFGIYQADLLGIHHLKTINQRINPQRAIAAEAQAVHGISYEDVKASPTWLDFAPTAKKILDRADMLVIHNAEFDESFLQGEMDRVGMPVGRRIPSFCTMENGRWATFDGKKPSLRELCWSLGIDYDPSAAHAADYDVTKMMECYSKAVVQGLFINPLRKEV